MHTSTHNTQKKHPHLHKHRQARPSSQNPPHPNPVVARKSNPTAKQQVLWRNGCPQQSKRNPWATLTMKKLKMMRSSMQKMAPQTPPPPLAHTKNPPKNSLQAMQPSKQQQRRSVLLVWSVCLDHPHNWSSPWRRPCWLRENDSSVQMVDWGSPLPNDQHLQQQVAFPDRRHRDDPCRGCYRRHPPGGDGPGSSVERRWTGSWRS